jgi:hypothetical protein
VTFTHPYDHTCPSIPECLLAFAFLPKVGHTRTVLANPTGTLQEIIAQRFCVQSAGDDCIEFPSCRLVSLSTENKLSSFVRDAKLAHPPPSRVTLVVSNLRGYLKGLRSSKSEVRSAIDDALAHILVFEGVGCRLEENELEAATAACRATRAVAEEPYRKKPTTAQRHLDDRKGKTQVLSSNAFARMLCSFPGIGDDASQSVTAVYPTVASLMRKYLDPSMGREEKVGLLADITSGARGKRLGPKASEKIFNILTSRDPTMTVSRLVK